MVHLIKLVIEIYDLFGHIDGFAPPPSELIVSSDGTSNPANSAMLRGKSNTVIFVPRFRRLFTTIFIPLLYYCSTVADACTTLKNYFLH